MTSTQKKRRKLTPTQLRELRVAAGLYQAQAAELLGISPNHYAVMERGETPITPTIAILARLVLIPHGSPRNI